MVTSTTNMSSAVLTNLGGGEWGSCSVSVLQKGMSSLRQLAIVKTNCSKQFMSFNSPSIPANQRMLLA